MRIRVEGMRAGRLRVHEFELIDYFDEESGNTAMARTTGFTAALAAKTMARRAVAREGVVFPEEVFLGETFDTLVGELASRGVDVTHREREIPQRRE